MVVVWCGLVCGDAATAACSCGTEALLVVVWGSGSGIGCEARDGFAPGKVGF